MDIWHLRPNGIWFAHRLAFFFLLFIAHQEALHLPDSFSTAGTRTPSYN